MTTTDKMTITMSERRPMKIVKADWPKVAQGSAYSGQYEFQAFDGARIDVRHHADGRWLVYGYAGDWDGGGRPERENRRAGYLVEAGGDVVRAIHRVAGVLSGTSHVGEDMAQRAARDCIADLPAEDAESGAPAPAATPDSLATLLALLVQAAPHCPEPLKTEIRDALRAGA